MPSAIYLCGGEFRPGPRDECPDRLHDWPLPAGYVDASEVASRRLAGRWTCKRCPRCGLYGWEPGKLGEGDVHVPAHAADETRECAAPNPAGRIVGTTWQCSCGTRWVLAHASEGGQPSIRAEWVRLG